MTVGFELYYKPLQGLAVIQKPQNINDLEHSPITRKRYNLAKTLPKSCQKYANDLAAFFDNRDNRRIAGALFFLSELGLPNFDAFAPCALFLMFASGNTKPTLTSCGEWVCVLLLAESFGNYFSSSLSAYLLGLGFLGLDL